jgi:hypothetical protein
LTEHEVALVRRWARRGRIVFWLVSPFAAVASVGALALAAMSLTDGGWGTGLVFLLCGCGVGLAYVLWHGSLKTYRDVSCATTVVTRSGVLREKTLHRSTLLCLDDLGVVFVNGEVRAAVELGEPCVLELIPNAPALVITARHASR